MVATNLDIYGSETIPWSRALEQLESTEGHLTYWLATTRPTDARTSPGWARRGSTGGCTS